MIARLWRGSTRKSKADEYLDYLKKTGARDLSSTPGNLGVQILRWINDGRAEFLVISLWESLEKIRAFAGADIEKAVYYPKDKEFLLSLEPKVTHYNVVFETRKNTKGS